MRKRILVVDDNTELLDLLREHLKAAGYSISTATDGVEALRKANSVVPDLIVLDLVLPELDGFAVCETLKKSRHTRSIPVILLTGLSSQFARFAGIESGAAEFVTKPVSPKQLIGKIQGLLAQGKKTKEQEQGNEQERPCMKGVQALLTSGAGEIA